MRHIFTIGLSTGDVEDTLSRLALHGVTAVADVRSTPYSQFTPQYNKEVLAKALKAHDVHYVYLGSELGARSDNPGDYVDGQVQFDRLADRTPYQHAIDRLVSGAADQVIALACTEKDPVDCHRTLLVGESLVSAGAKVVHILGDGAAETHPDTVMRIRALHGLEQPDLLHDESDLEREALKRQTKVVAFRRSEGE